MVNLLTGVILSNIRNCYKDNMANFGMEITKESMELFLDENTNLIIDYNTNKVIFEVKCPKSLIFGLSDIQRHEDTITRLIKMLDFIVQNNKQILESNSVKDIAS